MGHSIYISGDPLEKGQNLHIPPGKKISTFYSKLWRGRTKISLLPPGNFGITFQPLGKSFLLPGHSEIMSDPLENYHNYYPTLWKKEICKWTMLGLPNPWKKNNLYETPWKYPKIFL